MILCKSSNDSYIGKTVNFDYVKASNRSMYERGSNRNVYKFIREHGGLENFKYIKLEECPEEQALERKQFYLNKFMPSLNYRNR